MALRMDAAASQPPTHHRTAVPRRTSPPPEPTPQIGATKSAAPSRSGNTTNNNHNNSSTTSANKRPLAATRKRGAVAIAAAAAAAAAAMAAAAAAATATASSTAASTAGADSPSAKGGGGGGGGGGPSAVPGGGGGAVKGRDRGKKSGLESGAAAGPRTAGGATAVVVGSGGGAGSGNNSSGAARKRVRVTDKKLGEFAVVLQPFDGDHNDICERCDKGGDLLCCDFCNVVYHLHCVTPKLTEPPNELWLCPACTAEVTGRQINKRRRTDHDGGRSSSPATAGGAAASGRHQAQDRLPVYHGVKAENDAFRASVLYKNQVMDIGLFPTAQAAARAYDRKALSLFGDAAVCNFPADEQVEVEGVATDGTTVKGVVRSFHQWRAEMQWGNKKRHLGFFDRLDHASHAYNRAALYTNGPDTALNPTKEGYIPPPLTGRSVRVPRNKLFVQQLPLPLIALSQVEGTDNSAEFERRRQQMQGKYHVPLVGENHQVSSLPPLPPPSRPWAGVRPGATAAAAAAAAPAVQEAMGGKKMPASPSPSSGSSVALAAAAAELNSSSSSSSSSSAEDVGAERRGVELSLPGKVPATAVEDGMDVDEVAAAPALAGAEAGAALAAGTTTPPLLAASAIDPPCAAAPVTGGGGSDKGKGPARAAASDEETAGRSSSSSCSFPSPPLTVARPVAPVVKSREDNHCPAAGSSAAAVVVATESAPPPPPPAPAGSPSAAGVVAKPPTAVAVPALMACSPKECGSEGVGGEGVVDRPPAVSREGWTTVGMTDGASVCERATVPLEMPANAIRAVSVESSSLGDAETTMTTTAAAAAAAAAKEVFSPSTPPPVVAEAPDEGVSATVVTTASSAGSSSSDSSSSTGGGGDSGSVPLHQGIGSLCLYPAEVVAASGERLAAAVDAPCGQSDGGRRERDTNESLAVGKDASTDRHETPPENSGSGKISRLLPTSAGGGGVGYSVEGWQGLSVAAPSLSPMGPSNRSSTPPPVLTTDAASHGSRSTSPEAAAAAGGKQEPVPVVAATAAETKRSAAKGGTGEAVSAAPARGPSPGVAGRKRKLPLNAAQAANGTAGGSGSGGGSSRSPSRGRFHDGADALARPPPPPPPPPPRDLTFEDVAELVWDPRAGPKPRGMPEVRGPGGTIANKQALERAMWERDSTLLERVAPAHAEKAMQVLQMHRHDVERAAQMLTVRHGIHVVGLSSVRTTRNKRAEQQQQQQQQVLSPAPRPMSGRSGSGGGGGRSSGGAGFEGWQSAALSVPGQAATAGGAEPAATATAAAVSPRRGRKSDAQGVTREEAKLAGDAFMRHGRDLNAVQEALGWKKSRVVEYYYCVWKYSPAYQVWKATRHQAGLPGVGTGAGSGGSGTGAPSASTGGLTGGGLLHATSDGMRWRGSRLRTLKTPSSQ